MTNIDKLLHHVSKMRDCFAYYETNFDFSLSHFKQDWLANKYNDWEPALKTVIKEIDQILEEIGSALVHTFLDFNEYEEKNGPVHTRYSKGDFLYPKKLQLPTDDCFDEDEIIAINREDERKYWLKMNSEILKGELLHLKKELEICMEEYEENKYTSPYLPKLLPTDRIPFYGTKDSFILFAYLLAKSGFVVVDQDLGEDIKKELGETWNNELSEKRMNMNKYAASLGKTFYCINYDQTNKTWKEVNISGDISKKLNAGQKVRGKSSHDMLLAGFKQAISELESKPYQKKEPLKD